MDSNKKEFLKNSILGLLGSGALASLYILNRSKEDSKKDDAIESGESSNQITVPLSKQKFMRSVGRGSTEPPKTVKQDVSGMSDRDIEALKRSLLRKRASAKAPEEIKKTVSPKSSTFGIKGRDEKGRFTEAGSVSKQASIIHDKDDVVYGYTGAVAGSAAGLALAKLLYDKIVMNRELKKLNKSKRMYANMINKEVNDIDEPYYSKAAADRGIIGSTLGLAQVAGITTAATTGLIVYRIMENRRKALEAAADKDKSKYPEDKTIRFKFAEKGDSGNKKGFFA